MLLVSKWMPFSSSVPGSALALKDTAFQSGHTFSCSSELEGVTPKLTNLSPKDMVQPEGCAQAGAQPGPGTSTRPPSAMSPQLCSSISSLVASKSLLEVEVDDRGQLPSFPNDGRRRNDRSSSRLSKQPRFISHSYKTLNMFGKLKHIMFTYCKGTLMLAQGTLL